jgi:iron complex transport system substrate-binding protein
MTVSLRLGFALVGALLTVSSIGAPAVELELTTARPQRIVSLNLCTDELVLMLADRDNIKSVTWLVKDPRLSWLSEQAQGIPSNYGLAEEIVTLQPELVVAGSYTTPTTIALLKRLEVPVLQMDIPRSLEEVQSQIRLMAETLGHAARGERMVAEMQSRLAAMPALPAHDHAPTAALYQPNGMTATQGTLIHEALVVAGLQNLAVIRSLPNYAQLPLEVLLLDRPDLLVMNNYDQAAPSLAQELLRHPALTKTFTAASTVVIPAQTWSCGSPNIVRAIQRLRQAAITIVKAS